MKKSFLKEMKNVFLILAAIGFLATSCAHGSSTVSQRTVEGMVIGAGAGAAVGAVVGKGKGAAIGAGVGAIVGGAIGAQTGVQEEKSIRHEPTTLPWLKGEWIVVWSGSRGNESYDDSIRAVIEDELRKRAANVKAAEGRQYSGGYYYGRGGGRGEQDDLGCGQGTPFVLNYNLFQSGYDAMAQVQIVDCANHKQIKVQGEGRDRIRFYNSGGGGYYGRGGGYYSGSSSYGGSDYDSFANAVKEAMYNLH